MYFYTKKNDYSKRYGMKKNDFIALFITIAMVGCIAFSEYHPIRLDLTSDKRHSLPAQTKSLLMDFEQPMKATLYLSDDINQGFSELKKAAYDLLREMDAYSRHRITMEEQNLLDSHTAQEAIELMQDRGMPPIRVYEKSTKGEIKQKLAFPWIELSNGSRSIPINLLLNNTKLSSTENLHRSIEQLPAMLTDAVRQLYEKKIRKIVFLEGHGELTEIETYEASKLLSQYFQIDRGVLGNEHHILDTYEAVIIANPTLPFSEKDKFIIDQYIMRGGRVLWLIDGYKIDERKLSTTGKSPAIPLELNLSDILFKYGVRIGTRILQDSQSLQIPINVAQQNEPPSFIPIPWYYAPLLSPSSQHIITQNLSPIKGDFATTIELLKNNISKNIFLSTSEHTILLQTPTVIDIANIQQFDNDTHRSVPHLPVGVALEGHFSSIFAHRHPPKTLKIDKKDIIGESPITKQIFIADGSIIRNEVETKEDSTITLPIGYDRYSQRQFDNGQLITNTLLYLTDKENWITTKARNIPLHLLNKQNTTTLKKGVQTINILLPTTLYLLVVMLLLFFRSRKYVK